MRHDKELENRQRSVCFTEWVSTSSPGHARLSMFNGALAFGILRPVPFMTGILPPITHT